MANVYIFNIGDPSKAAHAEFGSKTMAAWWLQNMRWGVITAGFDNRAGDRGEEYLTEPKAGDVILAYAKGFGYVGVGRINADSSYQLLKRTRPNALSTHLHERAVAWDLTVSSVASAVPASQTGRTAPRHTREYGDESLERRVRRALLNNGAREFRPHKVWRVLDAFRIFDRPTSVPEATEWLERVLPGDNWGDVREDVTHFAVNDRNRQHYARGRVDFVTSRGNDRDALFKTKVQSNVFFQPYDSTAHGVWDLKLQNGRVEPVLIEESEGEKAYANARQKEDRVAEVDPVDSETDARTRTMQAIVVREGRTRFRDQLFEAYGGVCAMTGCKVKEILEAAHIVPYRGVHTDRTDNGLLLRADIHTLFDKGLLWVDDAFDIHISDKLSGSEYQTLQGQKIKMPTAKADRPKAEHLAHHRMTTVQA